MVYYVVNYIYLVLMIAGVIWLAETDGNWIEKISSKGKELLTIIFTIQKCEDDTTSVYNVDDG